MKKIKLISILLLFATIGSAQKPSWVLQKPGSNMMYSGIGMCLKTNADYLTKAKEAALADLTSEIKVEVSTSSILNTIEKDITTNGKTNSESNEFFEQNIKIKASEEISQFRLVDTWQDDKEYWVYYELPCMVWDEYLETRRNTAINKGFEFWYKGNYNLQQGDVVTAIELFLKGLEAIAPCANEPLICQYEDQKIDVGVELYSSLKSCFLGLTITLNPTQLEGKPYQGIETPTIITLSRNGLPIKNTKLKFEWKNGNGKLSANTTTQNDGTLALYIQNISSKEPKQELAITLDPQILHGFKGTIFENMASNIQLSFPQTTLTLSLGEQQINAFIKVADAGNEMIVSTIESMLSNNYFNIVESQNLADIVVNITSQFKKGAKVQTGTATHVEYISNVGIKINNNRSGDEILNYNIRNLKTLMPISTYEGDVKQLVLRDVNKRLKNNFPDEVSRLRISFEGERKAAPPTPAPTIPVCPTPTPSERPTSACPANNGGCPFKAVPPTPKPIIQQPAPTPATTTTTPTKNKKELYRGLWVQYEQLNQKTDGTWVEFTLFNTTDEDITLSFTANDLLVINEKGKNIKPIEIDFAGDTGKKFDKCTAILIPNLKTNLTLKCDKIKKAQVIMLKEGKQKGEIRMQIQE